MNRIKSLLLTASMALAMAFIFSCSLDDDNNGSNRGKGNDIANYRIVKIGTQTWMAENLDYAVEGSKCPAKCSKYGRLYTWETAMTVCPSGWHLPSADDWDILMNYVQTDNGGTYVSGRDASVAGKYLKAARGWNKGGNGEDKYGFAALPGGFGYADDFFTNVGHGGYWWTASESNGSYVHLWGMYYSYESAIWDSYYKFGLCSVRCVQD